MDSSHPATCEVAAPFVLVINCKRCNYLTRDHETLANTRWLKHCKRQCPRSWSTSDPTDMENRLGEAQAVAGRKLGQSREAGFAVGHAAPTVRLDLKKTWQKTLSQSAK